MVCENTLEGNAHGVISESDTLVYTEGQIGLAAWMIHKDNENYVTACFLMQDMSSTTSYRVELEGEFRLLK